ncbi:MAG TPA: hypothetical protein VMZ71_02220 [Gemmataceae bacterium]|nr:hypothetical protein [Gemmataceae bacterium]
MPITFGCPSCGKLMRVSDALGGKSVRCPHCQAVVVAPDDIPIAPVVQPSPAPLPPEPVAKPSPFAEMKSPPPSRAPRERVSGNADWSGFGSGCRLVGIGIWFEFVAVMVMFALFFYFALHNVLEGKSPAKPFSGAGAVLALLFFGPLLTGSVFVALGRVQMCAVPRFTGAGGLLTTCSVVAVLRPVMLLVAAGLVAMVEFGGGAPTLNDTATPIALLALVVGWIAELGMLPAMAIVGGAIPSERLRQAAGRLCFAVLLVTLLWLLVVVAVSALKESSPLGVFSPDPTPARRAAPPASREAAGDGTMLVVLAVFAVAQIGYTILHHALYSAGRSAARHAGTEDAD